MKRILSFPISILGFIKEIFQEMKLVEFPTRSESIKMTNVVLATSFILGLVLLTMDTLFVMGRNFLTTLNN